MFRGVGAAQEREAAVGAGKTRGARRERAIKSGGGDDSLVTIVSSDYRCVSCSASKHASARPDVPRDSVADAQPDDRRSTVRCACAPACHPRMQQQPQANGNGTPASPRKKQRMSTASGPVSKVTVVLGAQWGDEGKGKVVDMLAMDADVVCRCQVQYGFLARYVSFPATSDPPRPTHGESPLPAGRN